MNNESVEHLLNGKTVLIVEDEAIISFMLEDMMVELGAGKIFHAATIEEALSAIDARAPQVAILDLNLGGEFSYPVAERLENLGIPFLFTTGYGRVEARWSSHNIVQKPFELAAIASTLLKALAV